MAKRRAGAGKIPKRQRGEPIQEHLPGIRAGEKPTELEAAVERAARSDARRLRLPIDRLAEGSMLAAEAAAHMVATTRVSLDLHYERSPHVFRVDEKPGDSLDLGEVRWRRATSQMHATYRYGPRRIEETAECLGLAALLARDELRIRQRSEELTGADWIVSDETLSLESALRVEVSGLDSASRRSEIDYRLEEKKAQLERGMRRFPDGVPGIAVVVAIYPGVIATERVSAPDDGRGRG